MTSSNGNIFHVTGPLWGEFTGHRWIPLTKASDAELWCFPWSAPEQTVQQTIEMPVNWDTTTLIMKSLLCITFSSKFLWSVMTLKAHLLISHSTVIVVSYELYYVIIPCSTKLKGVYWYHLVRLSVRPCFCPSVDRIVSALYLLQYSPDPSHIYTSCQATSDSVSRGKFFKIKKFEVFGKFFKFVIFTLSCFDLASIMNWSILWVIMGQRGVSSERKRSSCSIWNLITAVVPHYIWGRSDGWAPMSFLIIVGFTFSWE